MATPLQTLLVRAPSFEGLNTEDSPLGQALTFALSAENAVIDRLGRLGSRLAFASDTTSIPTNETVLTETVRVEKNITQMGGGDINGEYVILCVVVVEQYNKENEVIRTDYFVCRRDDDVLTPMDMPPGIPDRTEIGRADIVYFNDRLYLFSNSNPALI